MNEKKKSNYESFYKLNAVLNSDMRHFFWGEWGGGAHRATL